MSLFLSFPRYLKAELILAKGNNINLFSCNRIYNRFYVLYGKWKDNSEEIFLKEFTLDWREIREKDLGINGFSAYLAYFNNKFYVAYTSSEKEGNVHMVEFDLDWNLIRNILVTPTPYDGEVAYQLIPLGNERLYLFYARNWVNDCGLKMIEFNSYLETVKEITLMPGEVNFHANQASEFSTVFANGHLYVAHKRYAPLKREVAESSSQEENKELQVKIQELEEEIENLLIERKVILERFDPYKKEKLEAIDSALKNKRSQFESLKKQFSQPQETTNINVMNVFLNEYTLNGELVKEKCIDRQEKLSPSLFFDNGLFYLAYDGYDETIMKPTIYAKQYDADWNLLKITRIHAPETGMPRDKAILVSEGRCYLISIAQQKIFVKEINFDLKEDKVIL